MTTFHSDEQFKCFVGSSYARPAAVFLFVPLMLLLLHLQWVILGGWPLFNFYHFLSPNDVPLWKYVIGGSAAVIGAIRYGPHAFKTLLNGSCVCAVEHETVRLYGKTVPLADVQRVRSVRGVFRKGLVFNLADGSEKYVCTIFNRHPNPENIVVRLRKYIQGRAI